MKADWLHPAWKVSSRVQAVTTTRASGSSVGPYAHFNLAAHVGDHRAAVDGNRVSLREATGCRRIQWLDQMHGNRIVHVCDESALTVPRADGAWTENPGIGLAVLTADCLPVVVCDISGFLVGIAHAGWRGLVDGVLQNLVEQMPVESRNLSAWIGPGIGGAVYEVGRDVAEAVDALGLAGDLQAQVMRPGNRPGKFLFDMGPLAEWILKASGVRDVAVVSGCCTYRDERFYSYRRDGTTGRMATLVWLLPS
ncbi:MAG: peptidoglycan editing factor PgeF [Gammaproteobacteria bacterium]|nr:peptidoglycan editing factor PgeF [Gammaproteobacteria bacterium]